MKPADLMHFGHVRIVLSPEKHVVVQIHPSTWSALAARCVGLPAAQGLEYRFDGVDWWNCRSGRKLETAGAKAALNAIVNFYRRN